MLQSKSSKNQKKTGLLILLIPGLFISLFLFGEVIGGDVSGLGHLIQLIPLILLGFIAVRHSYFSGITLVFLGFTLGITYALFSGFPFPTIIIVDLILFLPLIISGAFLIASSQPK